MKNQIQQAEEQYWSGMQKHHYETVKSLTQFPCLITGANGLRSVDEDSFKKMFDGHKGTEMKVSDLSEVHTKMLSDDFGVIMYRVTVDYNGKSMDCACTSTWQKQDGGWKCVIHSETPLQETK